jgi:hypothetical protein
MQTQMEVSMTDQSPEFKKLEKRLEGEPMVIGAYTLQPVAQVNGWQVALSGETGQGAGGLLRVTPHEVIVSKADDQPYSILLISEMESVLQGIAQTGIFIAALCGFGIMIAKIMGLLRR